MKRAVLIAAFLGIAAARAAITFGPAGTGILTFDALPATDQWSTLSIPGASGSISAEAVLDDAVQTSSASLFTALVVDSAQNPTPHTLAGWSSVRHAVYTGPAGVAAELVMATLRNNSGSTIQSFQIAYDLDSIPTTSPTPEEVPGQRVYFSLTGVANSWQLVPELTGDTGIGSHHAVLKVGAWAPGADLFVLWAQDNASHSPDACYLIDNFFAGPEPPPPPCVQTHPTNTTVAEGQATTFTATPCSNPPFFYQWFRNGAPIDGASNASLTIPRVHPADAGTYLVVLSNSTDAAASAAATLTVIPDDEPPRVVMAYLLPDTNSSQDTIVVLFSERVEANSAEAIGSFFLSGAAPEPHPAILDAALMNETAVVLHVENLASNVPYLLTIRDVTDQSSAHHPLSPNPTTIPVQTFGPPVVAADYVWKYFEAPTNTSWPGWMNAGFDDTAWISGPGAFGLPFDEVIPPPFIMRTMIRTPDAGGPITTYFRTWFNLPPWNTNAMVQLRGVFDEGGIVYLNGVEVWRVRMPNGPITTSTLSSNAFEPHALDGPIEIYAPGVLLPGANLVAVELHQVTPTSGDAVMGLVVGVSEVLPLCVPALAISRSLANTIRVSWTCGGTLQTSPTLGGPAESWSDVVTPANSFTTNLDAGALFFRVRR